WCRSRVSWYSQRYSRSQYASTRAANAGRSPCCAARTRRASSVGRGPACGELLWVCPDVATAVALAQPVSVPHPPYRVHSTSTDCPGQRCPLLAQHARPPGVGASPAQRPAHGQERAVADVDAVEVVVRPLPALEVEAVEGVAAGEVQAEVAG